MRKISVYTRDTQIGSSSYYRIWQYFNRMGNQYKIRDRSFVPGSITRLQYNYSNNKGIIGILVKLIYHMFVYLGSILFFMIDIIDTPNAVVILRSITPKTYKFPVNLLYRKLLEKTKIVIWDFDDNIFVNNEISDNEKELLEKKATYIIVTHEYLRSLLSKKYRDKTILMPTTEGDFSGLNFNEIIKKRIDDYDSIRMVWLASSAGLKDIEFISEELEQAAIILRKSYNKQLTLTIVCNKMPCIKSKVLKIQFCPWTRSKAIDELIKSHFGIMPLIDNEFSKGKGGFKIIQYMAAGLPQIASAVGFNNTVIDEGISGCLVNDNTEKQKWVESIVLLSTNMEKWKMMSYNSIQRWNTNFSFERNLHTWMELLDGIKTEKET